MEYLALIVFAITTCVTPGPNNTMLMASGLNYGIRRSLPHFLGICLGFPTMVVAIGLGLAGLFEQYPLLHVALKLAGCAYLSYLAYKIASAPISNHSESQGKPFSFLQAAAFQWVNPKAWVLAVGAMVSFTVIGENYPLQVVVIALIFLLFGTPCILLWLWFGAALKSVMQQPSMLRLFNVSMAILLMASLTPVFLDLYRQFSAQT
jgi:threonine/homoserine/homoserine lactone efflux protein